ncbi:hypothetical protein TSTA_000300 [Talaromyces stipitatus ATCC 10500]|uniref:Uncharacterized protein n=1 Tax=Talaromyces stipitatus (strain ATCC 10500 / CBS 375.48 / QM 6759 / NRRL 1006) TaxID=441959 RepID=B8MSF7_TALSN|nr:uncharacterized protein TSTA_000300 [Talaromyces stipitatus ATCC 10500]EED11952.1 hypothetical protein TSTA_000300 [Talaromyces stipitatus ATCC 10500]
MEGERRCIQCHGLQPLDQFIPKRKSECREYSAIGYRAKRLRNHTEERIQFHYRGIHSSDNTQHAQARQEHARISREHRSKRRHGEETSLTPSITQIMNAQVHQTPAQSIASQRYPTSSHSSTPTPRPLIICYFRCFQCEALRSNNDWFDDNEDICFYCADNTSFEEQNKYCIYGSHRVPRPAFCDVAGVESDTCHFCFSRDSTSIPSRHHTPIQLCPAVRRGPISQLDLSPHVDTVSNPHPLLEQQPRQGSQNTSSNEAPFVEDPPLDMSYENILSKPALHLDNWELVENFYNTLYSFAQEECGRCQEKWFKMKLRDGVWDRCRCVDRDQMIFLYSPGNNMDPSDVPTFLPELTQTEEMLIARVHVHMQIRQIRGQQYRYQGHIVNFLRDTQRVCNRLPLLPQNPNMVLLRPQNAETHERLNRQFRRDFRVKRGYIYAWLSYLIADHPGYRDIQINHANLTQLPEDGSVIDQILTEDVANESVDDDTDILAEADNPETVAVPDMTVSESEVQQLRQQLVTAQNPLHLTLPDPRSTPISEYKTTLPLLSLALPTLFPQGKADYSIPRERTVEFQQYAQHLMKYKDGRFARHPRFRFIMFNTMMRQRANAQAGFMVKRRSNLPNCTVDQLRAAFEEDSEESNSIVNSITRMSNTIQGTRSYWASRRSDLIAYNQNLGASHLFFTTTPADYQWDDLQRQFPNYKQWKNGDAIERRVIARENVVNNPHICAYWFWLRLKTFFKEILERSFNLKDYYTRYEWQKRGSTHSHILLWVKEAPNSEIEGLVSAQRAQYLDFWSRRVSAMNPHLRQQDEVIEEISTIQMPLERRVIDYIAKYATKAEKKTTSYRDLIKQVLPNVNSRNPMISMATKMINKLIGERDWSAQEICHMLLGLDLTEGSRTVINVNLYPENERQTLYIQDGQEQGSDDINFLTFLKQVDFRNAKNMRQLQDDNPDRVLKYFPQYKPGQQPEDYARVKLMLHHPFKNISDLLIDPDMCEVFKSYTEAYEYCCQNHMDDHKPDYYEEAPRPEADPFDPLQSQSDGTQDSWLDLALQLPGNNNIEQIEDPDRLGHRDLDRAYDWLPHIETMDGYRTDQLLVNLDGKAGTGKSYIINLLSTTLEAAARTRGAPPPIIRAAPTGVAAFNISGYTLHSLF